MAATMEKPVIIVGVDESDHSLYALEFTLHHFFPHTTNSPIYHSFKLIVVHAKPSPLSLAVGLDGPGASDMLQVLDSDLRRVAAIVVEKAQQLCRRISVNDVLVEVVEGDARNVLFDAVDKHHAAILVVGTHGYGSVKRAVLGSVSDYCVHHCNCSVLLVRQPKHE